MKANEFIKKYGIDEAKKAIENVAWCETAYCMRLKHGCFKTNSDCCIDINDLKRLVESHELVEKYKNIHGGIRFRIRWGMYRYGDTQQFNDRLKQAVADVEQCNGLL